jgi:beta-galactosidase
VVLWSVGNEIKEQGAKNSEQMTRRLVDICHREDPTRLCTSALSSPGAAVKSGFSKPLGVFGVNYQVNFYDDASVHGKVPMIGSETSSDVSSRGEYGLSMKDGKIATTQRANTQVTSYDTFRPRWATTAEVDLRAVEASPWLAGEFVWTGFDYIGEPTPFKWPARSSYFGIVDLAGFPKDRYYLYKSRWTTAPMVHLLPANWNWDGFEGQPIAVWCYTNADSVELFLNDKSLGEKRMKDTQDLHVEWPVTYEPGTLKAVAKKDGQIVATDTVVTAGKPSKLVLTADRGKVNAGIRDLSFVTVGVVDEKGNACPNANQDITYTIEGPGVIAGLDDGDATNHQAFRGTHHRVFHGLGLAVVQAGDATGEIHLTAAAEGLAPASATIMVAP